LSIFVSIASYRDPQLIPTILDCLAKARYPGDLRFGICWQHGDDEPALPFLHDRRFRIMDVHWSVSGGTCWARAEIMRLWYDEAFFLQLDSHHRFTPGWDARLLQHMERSGSAKPILTTYATPFRPGDPDEYESATMQMNFDRFTDEAIVLFRPSPIQECQRPNRPLRARFISAHFLFTTGDFVDAVPSDPDLYFIGEEISLTIRAYTHGYDLFHPPEIIVWHEYTREGRRKHWDDHVRTLGIEYEWHERDALSKERIKLFLAEPYIGQFGCGTARAFAEYEAYSGISFRHQQVQDETCRGEEPPSPPVRAGWAERIRTYRVQIDLDPAALDPVACMDPHFWYVGFHDGSGQEVYREDADEQEVREIVSSVSAPIQIQRTFHANREPVSWMVWPISYTHGWLQQQRGPIARTTAQVTLVTALLDIGRGQLNGPFARSFEDDLHHFASLLEIDLPMVIYMDPGQADVVWRARDPRNTEIIPLRPEDLRAFPYFQQVQEIRSRPEWSAQAGWLPSSPQAALEYYNPLVMSKMRWLEEQACQNPFGTEYLFWIDAGLCRTVDKHLLYMEELERQLVETAGDFLFIGFPYIGTAEIHGFPRHALAHTAGVDSVDRVIRGGFFGGRVSAVMETAALYDGILGSTLAAGHMGTEESIFTILSYHYPERFRCYMVEDNGLIGTFFEALRDTWAERLLLYPAAPQTVERQCLPRTVTLEEARPSNPWLADIGLYVLSFNAPDQFKAWLESIEDAAPDLLDSPHKVLLDNSTDASTASTYDDLCRRYGFTPTRHGNLGITGGRCWCARHFDAESHGDTMLYFEDDMLLHTQEGVCRNGFQTRVPNLFELAWEIVRREDLDFLKLSFTELHGDHTENWAYYNLDDQGRAVYFPAGPCTRVDAIKSYRGLPYLLGEVFYSNWPMLITRRGNRAMFLSDEVSPWEQLLMVQSLRLARAGALKSGVLLASPIHHNRVAPYDASERKEWCE
jgi:hypothetical protein